MFIDRYEIEAGLEFTQQMQMQINDAEPLFEQLSRYATSNKGTLFVHDTVADMNKHFLVAPGKKQSRPYSAGTLGLLDTTSRSTHIVKAPIGCMTHSLAHECAHFWQLLNNRWNGERGIQEVHAELLAAALIKFWGTDVDWFSYYYVLSHMGDVMKVTVIDTVINTQDAQHFIHDTLTA